MDTLTQLADYHYVSLSAIKRMRANGIDVHDHLEVEKQLSNQRHRPDSWISGNPNRYGVKFPSCETYQERDYLVCYCKGKKGKCVACRADLDFGCKYAMQRIEAGTF